MAGIKSLILSKLLRKNLLAISYAFLLLALFTTENRADAQITCDSLQCLKGDLNIDSVLTPVDLVLQLNCIFLGRGPCTSCLIDVNCDGSTSLFDVVTELNAIFLGISISSFAFPTITTADDSNVPEGEKAIYLEDAIRLALTEVESHTGCVKEKVDFPTGLVPFIYNALIHVYNDSSLEVRDSIVRIFRVHTFPYPFTNPLLVEIQLGTEWADAWKQGSQVTGNPKVDELVECYDLQLFDFFTWSNYHYALLSLTRPININSLGRRFMEVEGVNWAGADGFIDGDGNNITAKVGDNYWDLDYDAGWMDCLSGCLYHHFWRFRVYPSGNVELVASWGD